MLSREVEMVARNNKRERLTEETADFSEAEVEEGRSSRPSEARKVKFRMSDTVSTLEKKKFSWPVYRKLLKYAGKEWKLFVISIIMLLISSFFTSTLPFVIGVLLDKISHPD